MKWERVQILAQSRKFFDTYPDNGVTKNFMPHLWMLLLQSLTPREQEVLVIDGNTQPMSDADVVRFVLDRKIGPVGIGTMTRMVAKAYRVADARITNYFQDAAKGNGTGRETAGQSRQARAEERGDRPSGPEVMSLDDATALRSS